MNSPKRVLLVEGSDDLHVLAALLGRDGRIPRGSFEIQPLTGVERLIESVPVQLLASERERLGVLVDADTDLDARWSQLRSRVPELPAIPDAAGTVVQTGFGVQFGAWLMPDNQLPGRLEDFLALLIPTDNEDLPEVDRLLEAIRPRPFHANASWRPKARIHGWLSVQEMPGRPLGQAVTARYLAADGPHVDALIGWLSRLFVD